MNCSDYREAIQDLADGTLGPVRRAALQLHLDHCDACRALADDMQKIRAAAESLDDVRPPDHVWMQIAGRLRQEGRVTATVQPRARHMAVLAMAAALVLAVGASLYLLFPGRDTSAPGGAASTVAGDPASGDPAGGGNAAPVDPVQSVGEEFRLAEQHLQAGIAKLQEAAKADPNAIDPQTAATLQKNLAIIDQAIAESREALSTEPQSALARESLFDALRQKVTLLQNTIALMNEMRKGNSAAAAQLVDPGNKS
ncbi:MAG TPA: zf-HC2 domain-containing protein [Vicinamibacterales bacterium]|nr:zf-HC2 domain-containing protein [Vicinamibacterales bacterium]